MKLKELNLKNFGKFHNQTIRLGEGLNLIYEMCIRDRKWYR